MKANLNYPHRSTKMPLVKLTKTIVQANPGSHDSALVITVKVDERNFMVESIVSIQAFSFATLRHTDITSSLYDNFPYQVDLMVNEIDWKGVYMETSFDNYFNQAV